MMTLRDDLRWQVVLLSALSLGVIGLACDDDGDNNNANDAAVQTDAVADTAGTPATFGTLCTLDSQCTGAVDFCLISPDRGPPGVCTKINCDLNPSVCPSAWPCFDLNWLKTPGSPFASVTFPHVCLTPTLLPGADAGTDVGTPTPTPDAAADAATTADGAPTPTPDAATDTVSDAPADAAAS